MRDAEHRRTRSASSFVDPCFFASRFRWFSLCLFACAQRLTGGAALRAAFGGAALRAAFGGTRRPYTRAKGCNKGELQRMRATTFQERTVGKTVLGRRCALNLSRHALAERLCEKRWRKKHGTNMHSIWIQRLFPRWFSWQCPCILFTVVSIVFSAAVNIAVKTAVKFE